MKYTTEELYNAARDQWFGSNTIEYLGGDVLNDGREVAIFSNENIGEYFRFFVERNDGKLILKEYPWRKD